MTAIVRVESHAVNRKRLPQLTRKTGIVGARAETVRHEAGARGTGFTPFLLAGLAGRTWSVPLTSPRFPAANQRLGRPGRASLAAVEHYGRLVLRRPRPIRFGSHFTSLAFIGRR